MHRRRVIGRSGRHRGVTLVLTLLLVAVMSLAMAQQTLRSSRIRTATLAEGFTLESQWVALGVAEQWLARARDPEVDWAGIMKNARWQVGPLLVEAQTSAAEYKLCVRTVETQRWLAAWRRQPASAELLLVPDPKRVLTDSGFAAIECVLDPSQVSDRIAYRLPHHGRALADLVTVWGEGKVDLNRAPRDVLAAALVGYTDSQISTILRLREKEPLDSLDEVALKLGVSEDQRKVLEVVGAFAPRHLEMLIDVRRGRLFALFLAVIDVGSGKVVEVRTIQ